MKGGTVTNGGRVSFIRGNALTLPLADQSVHLIVSSPPYWKARDYQDADGSLDGQLGSEPTPHHFLANLWRVMDECWRVLRDDGSAWINLGDKFAGSGGHNNNGLGSKTLHTAGAANSAKNVANSYETRNRATRRSAPDRYQQATGGLRPKSRMELPHRFALGCQWPAYRRFEEEQAGLEPTVAAPQWILRMDVVWSKPNGMPESVTDRCRISHEYWLHLVKSERYFAAIDEIREPQDTVGRGRPWSTEVDGTLSGSVSRWGEVTGSQGLRGRRTAEQTNALNPLGKSPGSVWEVATEPLIVPSELGVDHFAAFPSEFPRRIVLGWSPSGVCVACGDPRRPVSSITGGGFDSERERERLSALQRTRVAVAGGAESSLGRRDVERMITGYACSCPTPDAPTRPSVVLDPFSGTGTTAVVAAALGRHGIGVELSADYLRLARWRDEDGGLRCKALGVEKPARQLDGQLSLLGGAL